MIFLLDALNFFLPLLTTQVCFWLFRQTYSGLRQDWGPRAWGRDETNGRSLNKKGGKSKLKIASIRFLHLTSHLLSFSVLPYNKCRVSIIIRFGVNNNNNYDNSCSKEKEGNTLFSLCKSIRPWLSGKKQIWDWFNCSWKCRDTYCVRGGYAFCVRVVGTS